MPAHAGPAARLPEPAPGPGHPRRRPAPAIGARREQRVQEVEALVPALGLEEPLDELMRLRSEQVVELDHAVAQLVHREAEQRVRAKRGQPHLDAVLAPAVLDERVALVQRRHERRVAAYGARLAHGQLALGAEDQVDVARGHLAPPKRLAAVLVVADVVAHEPAQPRVGPAREHLEGQLGGLVARDLEAHGNARWACSASPGIELASIPASEIVNSCPSSTSERRTSALCSARPASAMPAARSTVKPAAPLK